jgi:hypothetical protein
LISPHTLACCCGIAELSDGHIARIVNTIHIGSWHICSLI